MLTSTWLCVWLFYIVLIGSLYVWWSHFLCLGHNRRFMPRLLHSFKWTRMQTLIIVCLHFKKWNSLINSSQNSKAVTMLLRNSAWRISFFCFLLQVQADSSTSHLANRTVDLCQIQIWPSTRTLRDYLEPHAGSWSGGKASSDSFFVSYTEVLLYNNMASYPLAIFPFLNVFTWSPFLYFSPNLMDMVTNNSIKHQFYHNKPWLWH